MFTINLNLYFGGNNINGVYHKHTYLFRHNLCDSNRGYRKQICCKRVCKQIPSIQFHCYHYILDPEHQFHAHSRLFRRSWHYDYDCTFSLYDPILDLGINHLHLDYGPIPSILTSFTSNFIRARFTKFCSVKTSWIIFR